MKKTIAKIFNWANIFFSILARIWGIIATKFSMVKQGYYMAFLSVMGLSSIIIQFASHEWANLKLNEKGEITGNSDTISRLSSLAKYVAKWFVAGGVIIIIGLGLGEYLFLLMASNRNYLPFGNLNG